MTGKSFGFEKLAAELREDQDANSDQPAPTIDLAAAFPPKAAAGVDRQAADAARKVGEQTRLSRSSPASRPKPKAGAGRVKLSDVVPGSRPQVQEARTQLNVSTPVSVAQRFKQMKAESGLASEWQFLAALMDAYDRPVD